MRFIGETKLKQVTQAILQLGTVSADVVPPGSSLATGHAGDGDGKVVKGEPNFPVRVAEGVHFVVSTGLKYEPKRQLPDTTTKSERLLVELRSGPDLPSDTPPGQLLAVIEFVTRTDIAQRTNHTSWQTFEAFGTTADDRWTTPVMRLTKVVTCGNVANVADAGGARGMLGGPSAGVHGVRGGDKDRRIGDGDAGFMLRERKRVDGLEVQTPSG